MNLHRLHSKHFAYFRSVSTFSDSISGNIGNARNIAYFFVNTAFTAISIITAALSHLVTSSKDGLSVPLSQY
jgi:hypothetical protein